MYGCHGYLPGLPRRIITFASLLNKHPSSCPIEGVVKIVLHAYQNKILQDIPVIIYMYCDDSIFLFHDFKVRIQIHQISLKY